MMISSMSKKVMIRNAAGTLFEKWPETCPSCKKSLRIENVKLKKNELKHLSKKSKTKKTERKEKRKGGENTNRIRQTENEGKDRIRPTYSNLRATRTGNEIAGVKEAVGGNR